jgi:elongation factor P--(R)-beta-lysine ligase
MNDSDEWRPSASLEQLRLRSRLLSAVRRFFDARGYWEVDTPIVSRERVVDPHLDPFLVTGECEIAPDPPAKGASPARLYLHTSPEFSMKRLLAAGADAIYQIAHVFRHGELGKLHNPEFTMVEWYRVGDTHHDQMRVVEELVVDLWNDAMDQCAHSKCGTVPSPKVIETPAVPQFPFLRTTYREAFVRHAGVDVIPMETPQLAAWAGGRGLSPPPGLTVEDRDGWLNWLLAELVEPHLGCDRPEFLIDYPASQAALARVRPDDPPVAERFELYVRGIELCNGYHELGDADEILKRIEAESTRRGHEGQPRLAEPARFLASMRAGLPECSGVALGFDRLMLVATDAKTIGDVIPFSFERA